MCFLFENHRFLNTFQICCQNTLKQCVPLQQEFSFSLSCIYYINRFAYGEKA